MRDKRLWQTLICLLWGAGLFFQTQAVLADGHNQLLYKETKDGITMTARQVEAGPKQVALFIESKPRDTRIEDIKLIGPSGKKYFPAQFLRGMKAREALGQEQQKTQKSALGVAGKVVFGIGLTTIGQKEHHAAAEGTACSAKDEKSISERAAVGVGVGLIASASNATREEVALVTFDLDETQSQGYACKADVSKDEKKTEFRFVFDLVAVAEGGGVTQHDDLPPHTFEIQNPACHCQGGRLLIIAGVFDLKFPEEPWKNTDRFVKKETDPTILATLRWARNLNVNHLHMVAYPAAYGANPIQMENPYEVKDRPKGDAATPDPKKKQPEPEVNPPRASSSDKDEREPKPEPPEPEQADNKPAKSWQPVSFGASKSKDPKAVSKAMAAKWNDCCYYDEVIVFMHGSSYAYPRLIENLPYLLDGKPVRKLILWSCRSSNKFYPNTMGEEKNYEKICAIVKPKNCPCGCDPAKCIAFDADGHRTKCPTADKETVIYASYVVNKKAAKLGLSPTDMARPLTTPDGKLREVTVHPDGEITARSVNAETSNTEIFSGMKVKSKPGLEGKGDETINEGALLKKSRIEDSTKKKKPEEIKSSVPLCCPGREGCFSDGGLVK